MSKVQIIASFCLLAVLAPAGSASASERVCGFFSVLRDPSGHKAFHLVTRTGNDYALEVNPLLREKNLADGEQVCFTLTTFEHPYGPSYQVALDDGTAEKKKSRLSTKVYEE